MWAGRWKSREIFICVLAPWMQCCFCGIVYELLVDFRWPIIDELRMGVLEAQGGGVVGSTWPGLRSIESIK